MLANYSAALEWNTDNLLSLETNFSYLAGKYSDCFLFPT